MKIVIPARYASTRLPGKPLLMIAGKPMLQHVYEVAISSQAEEVVIATDDQRVADVASAFGAPVCMTATTHSSGTERIAEVIAQMNWNDDEILVNLQGDEPLMPVVLLDQVATDLQDHDRAQMATLAAPLENVNQIFDPNTVKLVIDKAGYAIYFSRAPIPWHRDDMQWGHHPYPALLQGFYRHIGLYAYRAGFVKTYINLPPAPMEQAESLEQLRVLWHGDAIHVSVAETIPPAGIDTAEDLARVKSLIELT